MRRAILCVVVAVFSLGVAACGGSSGSSAQTRTVQVDNTTGKYNGSFLAYFPNDVTVHPGDTVDFHENWTGEPHTVTMGTLVDAGLKIRTMRLPDRFQEHDKPEKQYDEARLNAPHIVETVLKALRINSAGVEEVRA